MNMTALHVRVQAARRACAAAAIAWSLGASAAPAGAQEVRLDRDEEAEVSFRRGTALYAGGNCREAAAAFGAVMKDFPNSHRITAAAVMKGKSEYRCGEHLEAARTFRAFLAAYPGSRYVPDARLGLGQVYAIIGRSEDALTEYLLASAALTVSSAPALRLQFLSAADSLIDAAVAPEALQRALARTPGPRERGYLWLKTAEGEARRQNIPAAAAALDSMERYPADVTAERIAALRGVVSNRSSLKLGVALPLMVNAPPSAVKQLGTEVYEGVQVALAEYASDPTNRMKVSLEVRDTEREPEAAARAVRTLAADLGVIGIVGPVFSTEAMAAAEAAQAGGIPLVTPTANAVGIAAKGSMVFQANADYDVRGRAMARFAVQKRGMTRLAVLAPEGTYAATLANSFVAEAQALGARIIALEWYQRGAQDLKSQFRAVRRAALREESVPLLDFGGKMKRADMMRLVDLGVPLRRVDSLMAKGARVPAAFVLGPDARRITDSLQIPVEYDEARVDSLEASVTSIQGIYVPVSSPEEIGVVASQAVFYHIDAQLLGSGEWNDYAELAANRRYCKGLVFETDAYIDSSTASYQGFAARYRTMFNRPPGRSTLYGYDSARLLLQAIRSGAGTRPALQRATESVRDFRGLRSRIGFGPGRVNRWLTIVEFDGDEVNRIEEISVE
jgi:ABC-type branched-subunit amino acid transport system substrate-binding protein